MRWLRRLLAWLGGALLAAVLGSLAQTQFNLAQLQAMGAVIDLSTRWTATLHDLSGFAPTWWALLVAGYALALPVAAWLSRRSGQAEYWFAASGAACVATILWSMKSVLGVTVVAAARHWPGFLALALTGAVGAWVSGRWLKAARSGQPARRSGEA